MALKILNSKIIVWLVVLASLVAILPSPVFAQDDPNPQDGAIGIEGSVPQEPPESAPTITIPGNGQTFDNPKIDVQGLCSAGLLVKLYNNKIFVGSTTCEDNGTYKITISLFGGQNELYAIQYDGLDQKSPKSNTVTVTLQALEAPGETSDQFFLTTPFARKGVNPKQTLIWPFTIKGGEGPYAISVNWGDGNTDLIPRETAGTFEATHEYEQSGTYQILIVATDENGNTSYLQVVAVVNGPISGNLDSGVDDTGGVRVVREFDIWPLLIMLFFVIVTFWLGKRYEKSRIRHKLRDHVPIEKI